MNRVGIDGFHFGNDGAVLQVLIDILLDILYRRLFVHVDDLDDADKRIGQAVLICHRENHRVNGIDSFIVELCAILHHDGRFGLCGIQRDVEQLASIPAILVGKGHCKLALVDRIHVSNCKRMNRRAGLGVFGNAERTVTVVVAFDALDIRLFIHVVNRHGNGSRIGQLRIILVRDSHLEGIGRRHLMVEFPIHLHDIGIHAERNILIHNGIDQFTICRSLGIGILGRNLTHFIINLGIFGNAECSIIDTRGFVHVNHIDNADKRIGETACIRKDQAHHIGRINFFVIELGAVLHENFHLRHITIELDIKERFCTTTVRVFDGERKHVGGIHVAHGKLVNRRARRRIFLDVIRAIAIVIVFKAIQVRIFIHVVNRNRHRSGIGQGIFMSIRDSHLEGIGRRHFMVEFTIHLHHVGIHAERHILIYNGIDQFAEEFIIIIRISYGQCTHFGIHRGIFRNREGSVFNRRSFVGIIHTNLGVGRNRFTRIVRKSQSHIEQDSTDRGIEQSFVIELSAILDRNHNIGVAHLGRIHIRVLNNRHVEQVFGTGSACLLVLVNQCSGQSANILSIGIKYERLADDIAVDHRIFLSAFHDIVLVIDLFELGIFVDILQLNRNGCRIGKVRESEILTVISHNHLHVVDAVLFIVQGIILLDSDLTGSSVDFKDFGNTGRRIKQRIGEHIPNVFIGSRDLANRVAHRGIFIDKEDDIVNLRLFVVVENLDDNFRLYRLFAFSIRRRSHIRYNHRNRQDAVSRFVIELCAGLNLNLQGTSVICANRIKGIYCIIVGICRLKCISELGVVDIIDREGAGDNFSGITIFLDFQGVANNGRSIVFRQHINRNGFGIPRKQAVFIDHAERE